MLNYTSILTFLAYLLFQEKKVYQDKASDLKTEYEKALESRNAEDEDVIRS